MELTAPADSIPKKVSLPQQFAGILVLGLTVFGITKVTDKKVKKQSGI